MNWLDWWNIWLIHQVLNNTSRDICNIPMNSGWNYMHGNVWVVWRGYSRISREREVYWWIWRNQYGRHLINRIIQHIDSILRWWYCIWWKCIQIFGDHAYWPVWMILKLRWIFRYPQYSYHVSIYIINHNMNYHHNYSIRYSQWCHPM